MTIESEKRIKKRKGKGVGDGRQGGRRKSGVKIGEWEDVHLA